MTGNERWLRDAAKELRDSRTRDAALQHYADFPITLAMQFESIADQIALAENALRPA